MKQSINKMWILAAAVSAVTLLPVSVSMAQYQINTGHTNDVNNRIGSGGQNADSRIGKSGQSSGVTGNDIVTGNVTGGKAFQGFVPYGDPRAFRGTLAEHNSDIFIRDPSGTPYAADSGYNSNAQNARPFFGDGRGVAPPDGFIRTAVGSSGYIPGPALDPTLNPSAGVTKTLTADTTTTNTPQFGQTVMQGPIDQSTNSDTLFTASPLYGVRQWNAGVDSDQTFIARYSNVFGDVANRLPLSDSQLQDMQREVLQQAGFLPDQQNQIMRNLQNQQNQQNSLNPNLAQPSLNSDVNQTASPDANLAQPLGAPLNSPNNSSLPQGQLQSNVPSNPLSGDMGTGQGISARMMVPAAEQSAANAAIEQRYEQLYGKKTENDVDRAADFNKQLMQAKSQEQKSGQPGTAQPGAGQPGAAQPGAAQPGAGATNSPGGTGAESLSVPGPTNAGAAKAPPQIKSFAEGVKAKGLSDLLTKGESEMKEGKWFNAIEQYDMAQRVAPNNMLIAVGRANAELGGSYYGRAEADLRRAFTQDPATLEGQYDLRTMIGNDRLEFLVKDLKDINTKNPTQSRSVFLLAYIAYNTGNERMAQGYLDVAQKRAGAGDTFYQLVRKHWSLPAQDATPAPDLNKQ